MKKTLRVVLALALALCMLSSSAMAASKKTSVMDAKPTLKLTVDQRKFECSEYVTYTLNPSHPGFATVELLDSDGSVSGSNPNVLLVLLRDTEVHSKANALNFSTIDPNGCLIQPGTYYMRASYRDQYGNQSPYAYASFGLTENNEYTEIAEESGKPLVYADFSAMQAVIDGTWVPVKETVRPEQTVPQNAPASETDDTEDASDTDAEPADDVLDMDDPDPYDDADIYDDADLYDETEGEADETSSRTGDVNLYGDPVEDSAAAPVSSSLGVPDTGLDYNTGSPLLGAEGLQIGVGVSDFAVQEEESYWTLPEDATDDQIWAAITRPMTAVDVAEDTLAYIYDSTSDSRQKLGSVSGVSQGVNVVQNLGAWSIVEAYRNEDGAFVRGYIRSKTLRTVDPNPTFGVVVDKSTKLLTIYKEGQKVGTCPVIIGMPTFEYLNRETPAGEYIFVTRRGTYQNPGSIGYSKYTIRFNNNHYLAEIPTKGKNSSDFSSYPEKLGTRASRGSIWLPHVASVDGGINAEWIWNMTDANKRVKLLVIDDKPRDLVPVGK